MQERRKEGQTRRDAVQAKREEAQADREEQRDREHAQMQAQLLELIIYGIDGIGIMLGLNQETRWKTL